MTPRGLARIGSMMLNTGMWGVRCVVPAQWIERSTSPMVDVDEIHSYGYLWYSGQIRVHRFDGAAVGALAA